MIDEKIYETFYWKVLLVEDQSYLGRCVILLKREAKHFSNLTQEEILDFHSNIVIKLEKVFQKTFDATMFNWTCLMNGAYKEENPKPHVHWHFRPRYSKKVEFEGITFEDKEFGHHYNRERKLNLPKEFLEKIATKIKENL